MLEQVGANAAKSKVKGMDWPTTHRIPHHSDHSMYVEHQRDLQLRYEMSLVCGTFSSEPAKRDRGNVAVVVRIGDRAH